MVAFTVPNPVPDPEVLNLTVEIMLDYLAEEVRVWHGVYNSIISVLRHS